MLLLLLFKNIKLIFLLSWTCMVTVMTMKIHVIKYYWWSGVKAQVRNFNSLSYDNYKCQSTCNLYEINHWCLVRHLYRLFYFIIQLVFILKCVCINQSVQPSAIDYDTRTYLLSLRVYLLFLFSNLFILLLSSRSIGLFTRKIYNNKILWMSKLDSLRC